MKKNQVPGERFEQVPAHVRHVEDLWVWTVWACWGQPQPQTGQYGCLQTYKRILCRSDTDAASSLDNISGHEVHLPKLVKGTVFNSNAHFSTQTIFFKLDTWKKKGRLHEKWVQHQFLWSICNFVSASTFQMQNIHDDNVKIWFSRVSLQQPSDLTTNLYSSNIRLVASNVRAGFSPLWYLFWLDVFFTCLFLWRGRMDLFSRPLSLSHTGTQGNSQAFLRSPVPPPRAGKGTFNISANVCHLS